MQQNESLEQDVIYAEFLANITNTIMNSIKAYEDKILYTDLLLVKNNELVYNVIKILKTAYSLALSNKDTFLKTWVEQKVSFFTEILDTYGLNLADYFEEMVEPRYNGTQEVPLENISVTLIVNDPFEELIYAMSDDIHSDLEDYIDDDIDDYDEEISPVEQSYFDGFDSGHAAGYEEGYEAGYSAAVTDLSKI